MSTARQGPLFPLFTRLLAVALVIGLPLTAYLLQRPATRGEQGGLVLRAGGGVWFCPEGSTDSGVAERIDLANPSTNAAKGRYTLFAGDRRFDSEQLTVAERGRASIDMNRELSGEGPGKQVGAVIELDLTAVAVAQTISVASPEVTGTLAAPCTAGTSPVRHFPGGSSLRGADTYLVLFNPFPQDAVVNVDVYTESGIERPKNLQQFPLFSGRNAVVKLSDEIRRRSTLGAVVRAESGQVVSQQVVHSNGERLPAGAALSQGSGDASPEWYFADGSTAMGQSIWVMNPGDAEVEVEIEYFPEGAVTETPAPHNMRVRPKSEATMTIAPSLPADTNFGFVVRSLDGSGVFVDRMVGHAPPQHGLSIGPGATEPLERWMIPNAWGAEQGVPYSNLLAVTNPGSVEAKLTVGRLEAEAVAVPTPLKDISVPPGARVTVAASKEFAGSKAMTLVGWSDEPLVVESRVVARPPRVGFEVMLPTPIPPTYSLPQAKEAPPVMPVEATPAVAPESSPQQ